jgi:flagellar protein FliO/FliZ
VNLPVALRPFLLALLAFSAPIHAEGEIAPAPTLPVSAPIPDLASSLAQTLGGLLVVIAALVACLWLIKRLSAPRQGTVRAVRVLGATAVGPRERVVMVEAGDKILMLGVTATNISALHVFTHDELALAPIAPGADKNAVDTTNAPPPAALSAFASRLRQALKRQP